MMATGRTVISCEIIHGPGTLPFTLALNTDHMMFGRYNFTAVVAPFQVVGNVFYYL